MECIVLKKSMAIFRFVAHVIIQKEKANESEEEEEEEGKSVKKQQQI